MSKRPSTPTRLTKAERKEQARLEREALQRKMRRAKRNRRILLVLSGLVVVAVAAFAFTQQEAGVDVPAPDELLAQAAEAQTAAGCGEIRNVGAYQPETQDQAHVPPEEAPPLSRYASVPPASGPHNEVPLGAGVYSTPPQVDRLLHSLEHGGVVVWYSPDASGQQLDRLRAFYEENAEAGSRVIVAPYDYASEGAGGQLPAGMQMSMVAWHYVQDCAEVNLAAAFDFSSKYAFPAFGEQEYLGEAPEPGGSM